MNALLKGLGPTPQLIIFGALVLTLIGLGSVAAMVAASMVFDIPFQDLPLLISQPEPKYAHALIWMNNITQLVGFALPVLLFFVLFSGQPIHYLMLNKGNIILLLAPVIIASAAPLIDLSSFINSLLIPENSWLEKTFKPTEELAERMTNMFMEPSSNVPIAVAFLSIAIIPALCEELVFRGVIMPLLAKATRNIHVSIWATAFLFSLIHMQFYGFLPRMIMGGLLGYLVVWSRSLWASIFAHFINNATAFYMFRLYGSMETPENSILNHWLFYLLASAVFVILLWLAWNKRVPVQGAATTHTFEH